MDENLQPGTQLIRASDAGDRRQAERRKLERTTVRSLLAVLLGAIALAAVVIAFWLQYSLSRQLERVQAEQRNVDTELTNLRAGLARSGHLGDLNAQRLQALDRLESTVTQLAESVTSLRERTEAGQRTWALAEARHLIEIANRRIALESDAGSALIALEIADTRLQNLRDPSLNLLRQTLAQEIQALRALPEPDIVGIVAHLTNAEELALQLPVIGAIDDRYRPERTEEGSAPGFARAWQLLRSSITNMISIRRIGKDAVELVSLEEQSVRRHHLQVLLFAARLAALRGDGALFSSHLTAARSWLTEMFDTRDSAVRGLNETLTQLQQRDISPALPDISGSLKALERLTAVRSAG